MGFATTGACFPNKITALDNWCVRVEPGNTAMSCRSCDAANSTCIVTYVPTSSTSSRTISIPVHTPTCTVPTPTTDALMYTSAIIILWAAVWAAKSLYNFFRAPHADSH